MRRVPGDSRSWREAVPPSLPIWASERKRGSLTGVLASGSEQDAPLPGGPGHFQRVAAGPGNQERAPPLVPLARQRAWVAGVIAMIPARSVAIWLVGVQSEDVPNPGIGLAPPPGQFPGTQVAHLQLHRLRIVWANFPNDFPLRPLRIAARVQMERRGGIGIVCNPDGSISQELARPLNTKLVGYGDGLRRLAGRTIGWRQVEQRGSRRRLRARRRCESWRARWRGALNGWPFRRAPTQQRQPQQAHKRPRRKMERSSCLASAKKSASHNTPAVWGEHGTPPYSESRGAGIPTPQRRLNAANHHASGSQQRLLSCSGRFQRHLQAKLGEERNHRLRHNREAGLEPGHEALQDRGKQDARLQISEGHADADTRTGAEREIGLRVIFLARFGVEALRLEGFRLRPEIGQPMCHPLAQQDDCTAPDDIAAVLEVASGEARLRPGGRIEPHGLFDDHIQVGKLRQIVYGWRAPAQHALKLG